jgi:hypothetical protein
MAAGDLGDALQVCREGQAPEHADGLHDVVVGDIALFVGQGAAIAG